MLHGCSVCVAHRSRLSVIIIIHLPRLNSASERLIQGPAIKIPCRRQSIRLEYAYMQFIRKELSFQMLLTTMKKVRESDHQIPSSEVYHWPAPMKWGIGLSVHVFIFDVSKYYPNLDQRFVSSRLVFHIICSLK